MNANHLAVLGALALSGCFTISQTEYPQVELSPAVAPSPTVSLAGFEASVTTYVPVFGYATVWNSSPGYYHCRRGRCHASWGFPETISTTSYIPQTQITTAYLNKAQESLESAGYVIAANKSSCIIDVKFTGPTITDDSRCAEFASMLFSLFTADRSSVTWSARMKITDSASGRVLMTQRYDQPYVSWVWGLIPIFGPLSADASQADYIQDWCLSALTDRAMADATAFLATLKIAE